MRKALTLLAIGALLTSGCEVQDPPERKITVLNSSTGEVVHQFEGKCNLTELRKPHKGRGAKIQVSCVESGEWKSHTVQLTSDEGYLRETL